MKKFILIILTITSLNAIETDVGLGFRIDSLDWTIGLGREEPNILSELKWRDVKSINVQVGFSTKVIRNIFLNLNFNYGRIVAGKNWDYDYWKNDRHNMFSESYSKADEGFVFDSKLAFMSTYTLPFGTIYDSIGLSYDKLHLSMIDGWQNDFTHSNFNSPLVGLDSRYSAQFYGPFLGAGYLVQAYMFCFDLGYSYTFLHYKGKGFWNLRRDIIGNFYHKANNGFGHTINLNIDVPYKNWNFGCLFLYRYFKVYNGVDLTRFEQDYAVINNEMKLNEVRWKNFSIYLYLSYEFFKETPRVGTRERIHRYFGN